MKIETFYTEKKIKKITLALISDIHYYTPCYNTNILIDLIKQTKKGNPDYICILGDILNDAKYTELIEIQNFLKELTYIAPVFVILGNHDEQTYQYGKPISLNNPTLINIIKKIDKVHFLKNNALTINNITFYGLNFSYDYYNGKEKYNAFVKEAIELKESLKENTYNIVLCHSPLNIYPFIKKNPTHFLNKTDLILSGHMHNGCIPQYISYPLNKIFKTSRSLISPYKTLFPKYSQGRIYHEKTEGFICRGVIKLSKTTKILHSLDILYTKKVEFITIEKK